SGNQITNGFIYLDGELLEFRGGIKQNSVVIIQEETKATFEDKTEKPVYFTRYATFGVSGNSIPWSDFKHIDNLIVLSNQVKKLKIELGKKATILDLVFEVKKLEKELAEIKPMYKEIKYVGTSVTQAELQRGWFIANGQNGTDNVLGRMLVGYDANQTEFNTIGKKGGEKTHKLTVSELPSHRIRYKDIFYSEYTGTVNIPSKIGSGHTDRDNKGHEMYRYSDSIGNDKPHNNLPPYIVALPIQFIG
ncbi:phage baseplate protein, partial [Tenacibaculum finnmarkense]